MEDVSDLFKDLEKSELSEYMFETGEKIKKINKPKIQIHKSHTNLDILNKFNNKINQVIFKYNSFHFPENTKDKQMFTKFNNSDKIVKSNIIKSLSLENNEDNIKNMSITNLRNSMDKILESKNTQIK